jgi:hypothetical protein
MEAMLPKVRPHGKKLSRDSEIEKNGERPQNLSLGMTLPLPARTLLEADHSSAWRTSDVLNLQRIVGNREVTRLLGGAATSVRRHVSPVAKANGRSGPVVQRYVDSGIGTERRSNSGAIILAGPHDLYARADLIKAANDKLLSVASGMGAFIKLTQGMPHPLYSNLLSVTPVWNNARTTTRGSDHENLKQAQGTQFKTQNDCYMTASLAAGIDDRDTGQGETTYGRYEVKNRNDQNGQMSNEASAPIGAKEMADRGVSKPSLAGGGMPYQAALRNMYRFHMLNMPVFRDYLQKEYRDDSPEHGAEEIAKVRAEIIEPIDQMEQKASLQEALQGYIRIYGTISKNPKLLQRFSAMFGVNEALNPQVGDALAIMNDPFERAKVQDRITKGENLDELWNYHFAGVVMKDDESGDFVTLENAADERNQKFNDQWSFYMYGSRSDSPDQTFHSQLAHGAHGPGIGESPLTMAFVSGKAPTPEVEHPKNNETITSPTYTINVKPEGPINNVRVQFDDQPAWQQARFHEGRWWFDWHGYDEGRHKIVVQAWNVNGQSVEVTRRVMYKPP